ncbi:hypothetical protein C8R44DRAFT_885536 [Mycena epipterygia]|nr:hypothetical protein C8R44DRAFT_885536 [Mycena epipterygia]
MATTFHTHTRLRGRTRVRRFRPPTSGPSSSVPTVNISILGALLPPTRPPRACRRCHPSPPPLVRRNSTSAFSESFDRQVSRIKFPHLTHHSHNPMPRSIPMFPSPHPILQSFTPQGDRQHVSLCAQIGMACSPMPACLEWLQYFKLDAPTALQTSWMGAFSIRHPII